MNDDSTVQDRSGLRELRHHLIKVCMDNIAIAAIKAHSTAVAVEDADAASYLHNLLVCLGVRNSSGCVVSSEMLGEHLYVDYPLTGQDRTGDKTVTALSREARHLRERANAITDLRKSSSWQVEGSVKVRALGEIMAQLSDKQLVELAQNIQRPDKAT